MKIEQPSAYVQQYKRYRRFEDIYKVTEIDIHAFRKRQAEIDSAYALKCEQRDNRISAFEAEIGQSLSHPILTKPTFEEKIEFGKMIRDHIIEKTVKYSI